MQKFIEELVLKILKARAVIILGKDNHYSYIGIPPEYVIPKNNFIENHANIPDNREDTWWT